jgi:hypothetical protein
MHKQNWKIPKILIRIIKFIIDEKAFLRQQKVLEYHYFLQGSLSSRSIEDSSIIYSTLAWS